MNKVMTRAQRHPGTRPPGRRDPRRPGSTSPRLPGDGTTRRTATDTRPAPPTGTPQAAPGATTAHPRVPEQSPRRPVGVPAVALPTDSFAERLLAVLSGLRPVHFMLGHTAGRAYDELTWLAERSPLRTTRGVRPVVRDIGWCEPRPGAIEAFARISAGDRLRAMAFRLELGRDRRWRCTAVELGGPRMPQDTTD
ncbi:Rv3235 family protein [Streptomyces sp. NPDC088387]|uniref:Rv3235 family protein n=1 Tax=Streptomyces sp. NPDC088387 TaxID=3365859 RepID=UPI003824DEE2